MGESYDVLIVGGGLGGASAATVVARSGLDVLVLERASTFRDRVRGEWVAAWGVLELEALGLREARERRGRLLEFFLSNPLASPVATMLLGVWALPAEAYSDDAWQTLVGV